MLLSRRSLTLAALALALAAGQVNAQARFYRNYNPGRPLVYTRPIDRNPQIAPGVYLGQVAYNTALMGQAYQQVPPYALGYNPYPSPVLGGVPAIPAVPVSPYAASPYALSTAGGYNPYLDPTGALSTSPYSLSTAGGGYSPAAASPYSYQGYGSPYNSGYGDSLGGSLQGVASATAAAGQYHLNVQQARIARETARQMALSTARQRIELQDWYDRTRPTSQQIRDREVAAELERTRKGASDVEVSSGKALNVLLSSIQKAGRLSSGPNVPLEADILPHINLAGASTAGNVGMLKDFSKLTWPEALQEAGYGEARRRLTGNLVRAVATLKDHEPIGATTLKDIRADYKTLNDKFNEAAEGDMAPSQFIEARRFLNQINQAVRALSDPNVGKYFDKTWSAQGSNVAELVAHLTKNGLTFAPAAPGDESAYKALYLAMRQFEAGLEAARK